MKKSDLSKTYRVHGEFVESIKEKSLDFIIETKERIEKADIINALIYKHLKDILRLNSNPLIFQLAQVIIMASQNMVDLL